MQAVENAIREGIIYWHAFPYNGQLELMDERHVRESVQLTHDLDAKYGYKPKITLSQVRPSCFNRLDGLCICLSTRKPSLLWQ